MKNLIKSSLLPLAMFTVVACAPQEEPAMQPEPVAEAGVAADAGVATTTNADTSVMATPAPMTPMMPAGPQTLTLMPMGTAGVNGEVMLSAAPADPAAAPGTPAAEGQTEVTVRLNDATGPAALPVFLYRGTCAMPQAMVGSVLVVPVQGEGMAMETAMIPAPMATLMGGELNIQVHPTGSAPSTALACANLMLKGGGM